MAENENKLNLGEIVVAGEISGLSAPLPQGLQQGRTYEIEAFYFSKATLTTPDKYGFPPRLKIHLLGTPNNNWYDASWFEKDESNKDS